MKRLAPVLAAASGYVAIATACDDDERAAPSPIFELPTVDAGTSAPVDSATPESECTKPTGPGTKHKSVAKGAAETWSAAESPHTIDYAVTIEGTVTLEPCAEL